MSNSGPVKNFNNITHFEKLIKSRLVSPRSARILRNAGNDPQKFAKDVEGFVGWRLMSDITAFCFVVATYIAASKVVYDAEYAKNYETDNLSEALQNNQSQLLGDLLGNLINPNAVKSKREASIRKQSQKGGFKYVFVELLRALAPKSIVNPLYADAVYSKFEARLKRITPWKFDRSQDMSVIRAQLELVLKINFDASVANRAVKTFAPLSHDAKTAKLNDENFNSFAMFLVATAERKTRQRLEIPAGVMTGNLSDKDIKSALTVLGDVMNEVFSEIAANRNMESIDSATLGTEEILSEMDDRNASEELLKMAKSRTEIYSAQTARRLFLTSFRAYLAEVEKTLMHHSNCKPRIFLTSIYLYSTMCEWYGIKLNGMWRHDPGYVSFIKSNADYQKFIRDNNLSSSAVSESANKPKTSKRKVGFSDDVPEGNKKQEDDEEDNVDKMYVDKMYDAIFQELEDRNAFEYGDTELGQTLQLNLYSPNGKRGANPFCKKVSGGGVNIYYKLEDFYNPKTADFMWKRFRVYFDATELADKYQEMENGGNPQKKYADLILSEYKKQEENLKHSDFRHEPDPPSDTADENPPVVHHEPPKEQIDLKPPQEHEETEKNVQKSSDKEPAPTVQEQSSDDNPGEHARVERRSAEQIIERIKLNLMGEMVVGENEINVSTNEKNDSTVFARNDGMVACEVPDKFAGDKKHTLTAWCSHSVNGSSVSYNVKLSLDTVEWLCKYQGDVKPLLKHFVESIQNTLRRAHRRVVLNQASSGDGYIPGAVLTEFVNIRRANYAKYGVTQSPEKKALKYYLDLKLKNGTLSQKLEFLDDLEDLICKTQVEEKVKYYGAVGLENIYHKFPYLLGVHRTSSDFKGILEKITGDPNLKKYKEKMIKS